VRVLAERYIELKNQRGGAIPVSKESTSYKTEVIAEVESDLDKFINVNVSFEKNQMETIKDVYEKYLAYSDFDENSVKRGEGLSRTQFTKFVLKNYKDFVYESVQRVRGGDPARAFVGMRLKTMSEIAEAEAAKQKAAQNAPAQVPAASQPKVAAAKATPTPELKDDVYPF
jgi:hypothetical protein